MIILAIGGSGSGKSRVAEELTQKRAEGGCVYYVATMLPFGEEGKKRIERHRKLREGKGFVTVEQPTKLREVLSKMEEANGTVLLECLSNLVANEMFTEDGKEDVGVVRDRILADIRFLGNTVKNLVIVSNNVFEDGVDYGEETKDYLECLSSLNATLAGLADEAYEIVMGRAVKLLARNGGLV